MGEQRKRNCISITVYVQCGPWSGRTLVERNHNPAGLRNKKLDLNEPKSLGRARMLEGSESILNSEPLALVDP